MVSKLLVQFFARSMCHVFDYYVLSTSASDLSATIIIIISTIFAEELICDELTFLLKRILLFVSVKFY